MNYIEEKLKEFDEKFGPILIPDMDGNNKSPFGDYFVYKPVRAYLELSLKSLAEEMINEIPDAMFNGNTPQGVDTKYLKQELREKYGK